MADSRQLLYLTEGVAAWNQWRSENPDVSIDLRKADLRDAELAGVNLREANLIGCDLRDAELDNADFTSANLSKANLTGARMRRASASAVNLSGARLNRVDATEANFVGANLSHCEISGAKFLGVNLSKATCKDAIINGTEFVGSNLASTDFRDSNLQDSLFVGASLEGADLRRCVLKRTSFESANLTNANFRHARFGHAVLVGAKITRANFRDVITLSCDELTQARDWQTAYRDPELACDAPIPVEDTMAGNTNEFGSPTGMVPLIDDLFGAQLSSWRQDITESDQRAQLEKSRKALIELEKALTDFPSNVEPGQMGHNMPPEPMIPHEVLDQCIAEVRAGLALHDAPRPDKYQFTRLRDILGRFRQWLQPRIDTAADSAAKAFGAAVVAGAAALVAKLSGAWDQLGVLISMLG